MDFLKENKGLLVTALVVAVCVYLMSGVGVANNVENTDDQNTKTEQASKEEKVVEVNTSTGEEKTSSESELLKNKDTETVEEPIKNDTELSEDVQHYEYTAQVGDSYTALARKAVQTYGKTAGINLSKAQIVAAETMLTQEAKSPYLNQKQKVKVEVLDVASVVQKVLKMSKSEEEAWVVYVSGVDFNTDNVGE